MKCREDHGWRCPACKSFHQYRDIYPENDVYIFSAFTPESAARIAFNPCCNINYWNKVFSSKMNDIYNSESGVSINSKYEQEFDAEFKDG